MPGAPRPIDRSTVSVVIPCLDEEAAIGACVAAFSRMAWAR